jgi:hypothetical protein
MHGRCGDGSDALARTLLVETETMPHSSVSRSKRGPAKKCDVRQPDLFEWREEPASPVADVAVAAAAVVSAPAKPKQRDLQRPRATAQSAQTQRIEVDQIPNYDPHDVREVDAALTGVPATKVWFTYRDIKSMFGVSRATVARKVQARLVPGIRFEGRRVVEDGPVRRFSRDQVRFVLLAVRRRI